MTRLEKLWERCNRAQRPDRISPAKARRIHERWLAWKKRQKWS